MSNLYRVTLVNERTGRVHVNTVCADTVPEAAAIAREISGHCVLDVVIAPTAAEAAR